MREAVAIVGEVVVRVDQTLLGAPGATLEGIRRIWSHPQALAQCEEFLATLGAEVIPMYDTAGAAKRVAEEGRTDQAAVAAERAAGVYGLDVLARRIQTHQDNQTRFAVIARTAPDGAPTPPLAQPDKTTIVFGVRHVPGALVRALSTFAFRGLNLAKIESRPLGDRPWEYRFYVDVEAGTDDPLLQDALEELRREGRALQVLGSYPRLALAGRPGRIELVARLRGLHRTVWCPGINITPLDRSTTLARAVRVRRRPVSRSERSRTMPHVHAKFVTSMGTFTVRLMPDHAPKTVENFVGLATGTREWTDPRTRRAGEGSLYAGTVFHRVIDGFMIQGGDPQGDGRGGPGYTFGDEVPSGGPAFDRVGLLAMANAGPNTNGSQFFVTVTRTPHLNGKHTIFGEVIDGYEVVEAIATTPTDRHDRPLTPVVIERIDVEREDT
jgi:peptidyl-prolyl cis-trans isomerase A (cyclophilin A)